jgi:acyl carrier protein
MLWRTPEHAKGYEVLIDDVRTVLNAALQLRRRLDGCDASTPLLGAIPELDSMAVVNVITALEEHFGFTIADDEIGAATFATLGSLTDFVEEKIAA